MKAFLFASACSVLGLLPLLAGSVTVESEYFTVDTTAKLTVVPTSCNWQQGSITIGWASNYTSANKPTYTVYWANSTNNFESEGFFTDRSNVTEIRAGMLGNSFTDDQYYKRGDGTQIIYYCVKGSDGSKGCCATRRRYGLFLGFNNQGIDPSSRNANELWNQYVLAGGVLNHEDAICRIDNNRQQIHALLAGFASCAKKGDIFVFYVFAHGMQGSLLGNFEGFSLGGGAYYENSLLKDDLDNIGRQGVAVIAILEPCGSGQIATKCGTKNNKAFINAGTWKETAFFTSDTELSQYSGTQYSLFGRAFIDWGWLDGCAGSNGTATYYDLFVYAKKQVAGISYNETREPSALNDKI